MKKFVLRTTTVSLSLIVSLTVAEILVRTFAPQDLGLLAPWYQSHPRYRFRHYPNMDADRRWGLPYHLRTNSHGIRADDEEPYESPLETRIVVHGDSLTFGVGVEQQDTYVQRVQRELRRRVPMVDVLNLGVSGSGPDQQYLLFLEEGRKYSPRICVIAVCLGNDLDEAAWSRAAFRLEGDRLVFIPYEAPLSKRLAETAVYRWLASRSHLMVLIRFNLVDARIQAREFAAQEKRDPPLALAMAIYRDFVAAVKNEGSVPVILLLPTREHIARERGLTRVEPAASAEILRQALLQFCATQDVTCIDALDGFARPDVPFDRLFIPGDDHFSAAGNQVIADVLTEPLRQILE